MIENVIMDCLYFVLLTISAMIGFGLAFFIAFQSSLGDETCNSNDLQEGECKENEVREKTNMSFGSPWMAVLTMFYAMLGTIETEVNLNYHSHFTAR